MRPTHARTPVALVVEDDPDLRSMAATLLEETDLDVVEAESAESALAYLRDHAEGVRLLFSDVNLPCLMSGSDLARTVSVRWPHIRVVLTSGDPSASAGMPDDAVFMPKPWRALDVLVQAERATGSRGR